MSKHIVVGFSLMAAAVAAILYIVITIAGH